MSRRLLLASGSSGSVIPVDPDDPGGGGGGGDGWPTTTDPNILALRPTGVRVLATRTATPGTSLGPDNLQVLGDAINAQLETPYGYAGPEHHGILFLPPGEYLGGTGTNQWFAVIGTTGNPEDVIIHSESIASDGVLHPYSPVYFEGVTLKGSYSESLQQSPKYAAHISGSSRTTFVNVNFDVTDARVSSPADTTWGCAGTVGMDGGYSTVLTFYKCQFYDVTGEGRLGMNLHGGDAHPLQSARISFIDCTAPKGVGYSASYGAKRDEVYVIGGDIGGTIQVGGDVDVYTDLPNDVTGATSLTRDHTDWPLPLSGEHGLVHDWFLNLYPSGLDKPGTTIARAAVTDTAPMTPVAGRTYYCPVPITEGLHFNRFGVYVRSGAGKTIAFRPRPDTNHNYPVNEDMTTGTLSAGQMLAGYFYSWIRYPDTSIGGARMWFHFKLPDATGVSIDGSAMLPGLHDCYYSDDNGTTLVKATAGTPFPLAHAAQVR